MIIGSVDKPARVGVLRCLWAPPSLGQKWAISHRDSVMCATANTHQSSLLPSSVSFILKVFGAALEGACTLGPAALHFTSCRHYLAKIPTDAGPPSCFAINPIRRSHWLQLTLLLASPPGPRLVFLLIMALFMIPPWCTHLLAPTISTLHHLPLVMGNPSTCPMHQLLRPLSPSFVCCVI